MIEEDIIIPFTRLREEDVKFSLRIENSHKLVKLVPQDIGAILDPSIIRNVLTGEQVKQLISDITSDTVIRGAHKRVRPGLEVSALDLSCDVVFIKTRYFFPFLRKKSQAVIQAVIVENKSTTDVDILHNICGIPILYDKDIETENITVTKKEGCSDVLEIYFRIKVPKSLLAPLPE